jgi:hypothetical protein
MVFMRVCTYCGKENDDSAGFCIGCHDSLDHPLHSFPVVSDEKKGERGIFAEIGLIVGITGTCIVALTSYPVFLLPRGTPLRPMVWSVALVLTAVGTFVIGLPCAFFGTTSNKRLIGWLGVGLCVAPAPLGFAMLHIAMALHGLELEQ